MAAMMSGRTLGRRMIAVITTATAISAVALVSGCASGPQASALASDIVLQRLS
jgi:outer membrane murein-binding lipoprotein Lpp